MQNDVAHCLPIAINKSIESMQPNRGRRNSVSDKRKHINRVQRRWQSKLVEAAGIEPVWMLAADRCPLMPSDASSYHKHWFAGVFLRPELLPSARPSEEMSLWHSFTVSSKGWFVDVFHAQTSCETH